MIWVYLSVSWLVAGSITLAIANAFDKGYQPLDTADNGAIGARVVIVLLWPLIVFGTILYMFVYTPFFSLCNWAKNRKKDAVERETNEYKKALQAWMKYHADPESFDPNKDESPWGMTRKIL